MKIVLAALNAKYVHSNLAVYDLRAYAQEKWSTEGKRAPELIVREYTINHNLDWILQSLYQEKAEVVAFSCYIWNMYEVLTVAKELSKILPQTHIWFGGPEVSYDSREVLEKNPFVAGIMQGEGEETFYELTKVWSGQSGGLEADYTDVSGIIYKDSNNRICQNPQRALMKLDDVPFVYGDLSGFVHKILYYESSRGCPFSCSYCLSSVDKHVRFRSLSLVERELEFFLEHRVLQVKFIDRTFNCQPERARAIWQYITKHDNGVTNFHFEVAGDLLEEEDMALFRRMRQGLIQLEIGLQSTNPDAIREIRRTMDVEKLKKNMLAIQKMGNIHQHLDLIAGLPYEDFLSFQKSFNEACAMCPNQLQLGFLKVLKGSYMAEKAKEYELCYQEHQPYEVLSTKWISYDEIIALKRVEEMVEIYYNSGQYSHVLRYLISFFTSPFAFYETIGDYYAHKELSGIGFKREARYTVLRDFCVEHFAGEDSFSLKILDNLLTFDYYLRENAKNRPAWSKAEPIEKEIYHAFFKNGGTEEINLNHKDYNWKTASRSMHIEPVDEEAVCWLRDFPEEETKQIQYALFDYEERNPLSKAAKVVWLKHL